MNHGHERGMNGNAATRRADAMQRGRCMAWAWWMAWVAVGALHPRVDAGRVPWVTSRVEGSPEPPPAARVDRVRPDVTFKSPVELEHDRVRNLWWVAQHGGQVLVMPARGTGPGDPGTGALAGVPRVALDLAANGRPFNQLLGFALDPGHATNRWIFVAYVNADGKPDGSRVSRFTFADGASPVVDPGSEVVLLTWLGGGHNGCALRFGPDHKLYISTGDGSSPEPPDALRTGQRLDDLLSSILRVDVHPADGTRPMAVPADNPFVGRPGVRPEIWAYGFRNPWRMGFAPDGSLWVSDVGWELWETVHRVTAGYNGGWAREEGPHLVDASVEAPTPVGRPVAAHPHTEAASLTGGVFHRGKALARFRGHHVYGDWETGKVWMLSTAAGASPVEVADTPLKIVAFANGPGDETYVLDHQGGGLHRLDDNTGRPSTEFPRRLSATGLFLDVARHEPAPGVLPYDVVEPRWHEGASARRWVGIPGDAPVEPGAWRGGTVLAKTLFAPAANAGATAQAAGAGRPIETQLLHFNGESWAAYAYRWNNKATDADLVAADGDSAEVEWAGEGRRRWTIHARSDCLRCHNAWPGFVLGFNVAQLAGSGTLEGWRAKGWVAPNVATNAAFHLAHRGDETAPMERRARSWLHVNCSPCHRFGAGAAVAARFGMEEPLGKSAVLDARPARGTFGIGDARLIAPGEPARSVVFHRIVTGGSGHMPPMGGRRPDFAGARVVADWIRAMGPHVGTARPGEGTLEESLEDLSRILPGKPPAERVKAGLASNHGSVRDVWMPHAPEGMRRDTMGDRVPVQQILAARGNPMRGQRVFESPDGPGCIRCHAVGGKGGRFGPDLGRIGAERTRAELMDSLVNPARLVADAYRLHVVELKDGTTATGFVEVATDGTRRIRMEDGAERRLRGDEVARDETMAGSAMPEGLLSGLTVSEAADLLAYLAGLKPGK